MTVTLVGTDGERLPDGARRALAAAAVVVGDDTLAPDGVPTAGAIDETDLRPAVVLAPGDPGFVGGGHAIGGTRPEVLPSVTAFQRLAARIALPWDQLTVVDARTDGGVRRAVNLCHARRAVGVLTGHGAGPSELAAGLDGLSRTLVVLEDPGGRRERLSTVPVGEAAARWWREPNLLICLADAAAVPDRGWHAGTVPAPTGGWALPAARFSHRAGDLWCEAARSVILARLAPRPGAMVWDVAARCGAVAVDCARLGAAVIAVDADPVQCVRITANAAAHAVETRVVEGAAPAALRRLPRPDSVFVGGGALDVVSYCVRAGAARVVVALRDPEPVGRVLESLRTAGYTAGGAVISSSRGVDLPDGTTRLAAEDPVILVWGTG